MSSRKIRAQVEQQLQGAIEAQYQNRAQSLREQKKESQLREIVNNSKDPKDVLLGAVTAIKDLKFPRLPENEPTWKGLTTSAKLSAKNHFIVAVLAMKGHGRMANNSRLIRFRDSATSLRDIFLDAETFVFNLINSHWTKQWLFGSDFEVIADSSFGSSSLLSFLETCQIGWTHEIVQENLFLLFAFHAAPSDSKVTHWYQRFTSSDVSDTFQDIVYTFLDPSKLTSVGIDISSSFSQDSRYQIDSLTMKKYHDVAYTYYAYLQVDYMVKYPRHRQYPSIQNSQEVLGVATYLDYCSFAETGYSRFIHHCLAHFPYQDPSKSSPSLPEYVNWKEAIVKEDRNFVLHHFSTIPLTMYKTPLSSPPSQLELLPHALSTFARQLALPARHTDLKFLKGALSATCNFPMKLPFLFKATAGQPGDPARDMAQRLYDYYSQFCSDFYDKFTDLGRLALKNNFLITILHHHDLMHSPEIQQSDGQIGAALNLVPNGQHQAALSVAYAWGIMQGHFHPIAKAMIKLSSQFGWQPQVVSEHAFGSHHPKFKSALHTLMDLGVSEDVLFKKEYTFLWYGTYFGMRTVPYQSKFAPQDLRRLDLNLKALYVGSQTMDVNFATRLRSGSLRGVSKESPDEKLTQAIKREYLRLQIDYRIIKSEATENEDVKSYGSDFTGFLKERRAKAKDKAAM